MAQFDSPTYAPDWTPRNLSRLESLKEGIEADVLVYQVENPHLPSIRAKALRTGIDVAITVRIGADEQECGWYHDNLMEHVKIERDKQGR
jgi:hypothetical protein